MNKGKPPSQTFLAILGGFLLTFIAISLYVPRVGNGSENSKILLARWRAENQERDSVNQDLARRDFSAAESAFRRYDALFLGRSWTLQRAELDFQEGKKDEARKLYRSIFSFRNRDEIPLNIAVRYGNLAFAAGDLKQARRAFIWVIGRKDLWPRVPIPKPTLSTASLEDLRGIAVALGAHSDPWDKKSYYLESGKAEVWAPRSPLVAWVRGDALFDCGLLADSQVKFKEAVALCPVSLRAAVYVCINRAYPFELIDHTSVVKVGPRGKVTVKVVSRPLRNRLYFGFYSPTGVPSTFPSK